MNHRPSILNNIPPVVKNILIINVIFYIACFIMPGALGFKLEDYLGLHIPMAEKFNPVQIVTYMFLHAYYSPVQGVIFAHLFFNMFAVYMFGRVLEQVWGAKRFLIYYFVTGIGAAVVHLATQYIEIMPVINAINNYMNNASHENLELFLNNHLVIASHDIQINFSAFSKAYNGLINTDPGRAIGLSKEFLHQYQIDFLNAHITVGASGAVFGILLAFGMLFPNTELMLIFPPIPIKAKYFVFIYGAIELFMGVTNFRLDNVAHWAHLGGMLFGFFLIRHWKNKGSMY